MASHTEEIQARNRRDMEEAHQQVLERTITEPVVLVVEPGSSAYVSNGGYDNTIKRMITQFLGLSRRAVDRATLASREIQDVLDTFEDAKGVYAVSTDEAVLRAINTKYPGRVQTLQRDLSTDPLVLNPRPDIVLCYDALQGMKNPAQGLEVLLRTVTRGGLVSTDTGLPVFLEGKRFFPIEGSSNLYTC
ncbi:hypothetical protein GOV09_01865 [Candidatus Woesearchaeota archaeon]|nr:hypothetical protein [Candidatus Woesearchaeota archaeon]